jgi:type II secretory pathway pseudopilin PulG
MIYVLIVISMLLVMGLGAASLSMGGLARARSNEKNSVAFNAAQAVMEIGITETLEELGGNFGVFEATSVDVSATVNSIAPGCTAAYTITPSTSDPQWGWITATVTYLGKSKSIRGTLSAKDLGIWNNAVFAGSGAAGRSINGNVDIRGSVHVLGEGEPYTDTNGDGTWTAAELFTDANNNGVWDPGELFTDSNGDRVWTSAEPYNDLNFNGAYDNPTIASELSSQFSGGALIGNNYSGMDPALEALVATSPKKNGIETLSAELRVKHGQISLDGTATVGQSGTIDGGTSKATLDGVYVNDGWTGNKGALNVFSDNGTANAYDIESLDVKMPLLSGVGAAEYVDDSGTSWADQETYMNARSLTLPMTSLTATTAAFSYGPDAYGNSISFVPATALTPATVNITGVVKIPDGFQLGDKDSIRYSGNGSFWCPGSMKIDGNFTPAPGLSFPVTARVGIIAKNTIALASGGGSSQLTLAGAFYAQNKITSAKQNKIAGTFVATTFDMGTNVPSVYQIPVLRTNLPPAMPGSKPIIYLRLRGWRERL